MAEITGMISKWRKFENTTPQNAASNSTRLYARLYYAKLSCANTYFNHHVKRVVLAGGVGTGEGMGVKIRIHMELEIELNEN